jgi:hemerythrin-like domain-containing protein
VAKAIDDLKLEHEAILSGLQILAVFAARIDRGLDVEKRDIYDFLRFLKEFADKCHHGKEEGILFPAMVKAGIPDKGGPVGVMLSEHAKGRELVKGMEAAVGVPDLKKFARLATEYSDHLKAHIEKENGVLFPTAERVLADAQMEQIVGAFQKHEEKVIGAGRHEELHAILKKLRQKNSA